jgi:hypothetical protein
MSDETSTELKPEPRQLAQAVNSFLKRALPSFTVEKCAEAVILTLTSFFDVEQLVAFLWESARQSTRRTRLTLKDNLLLREWETAPPAEIVQREATAHSQDDLKLVLHRTLKSLPIDSALRESLEQQGCRAAIEIHFAYYTRPILKIVLGLSNPRLLPANEAQDFLLTFCRCCHISLNGAYLAELDEREGRRESPEVRDRFYLVLQWFHSLVRHLNTAVSGVQTAQIAQTEDALDRASIVAGICLAEIVELMTKVKDSSDLAMAGPGSQT